MAISKSFKEKWICGLKSGLVGQITGSLGSKDGDVCVLGMGCRVMGIDPEKDGYEDLKRLGVGEELQGELMNLNDRKQWSFDRLAKWIDKNVPTR